MPDKLPELVIYDFCETLVSIQTADFFVDYVCKHSNRFNLTDKIEKLLIKTKVKFAINLLFPKFNFSKKLNFFVINL